MTDFLRIYAEEAAAYEAMVAAEDVDRELPRALAEIVDCAGKSVVEFGAGTGRLTAMLGPVAARYFACDQSAHMLDIARRKMVVIGGDNWTVQVADNFHLPLADGVADVAIEGWSFGHYVDWSLPDWQPVLAALFAEMDRVSKPGATQIVLETLGTGHETPITIFPEFGHFLGWMENELGFQRRWIRTDYQFASPADAAEKTRFFFGDGLADRILAAGISRLPECTGIWWRTFDH
jgi:SAM-dependent methyltransferase